MADYVRKTILSQGYAHIESVHLTPEEKKAFEVGIAAYQKPRAQILLGADIIPEVKTKDGSLIVYSTVYGSLADALGNVEDFQKSLAMLYGSSKMLADACILESLFFSKGKKKDLIRAEARTGVIKSSKDLFDRVTSLCEAKQQESHKRLGDILTDIEKKSLFLNQQLTYARDRKLVWGNFLPLLKRLSANFHRLPITPNEERLHIYKENIAGIASQVKKFRDQKDDNEP